MESLFKIIFQNGEAIQERSSFIGISIDTIFTVLVTVFIFILGYIFNRKIEAKKENKRLIELEEYFLKLIELLEEPLIKQKNVLVDLSNILKQKTDKHYALEIVSSFRVDLIKEIENIDLYNIFIKRKKGDLNEKTKLFSKIRGQVDYLDEVKLSIKISFEELTHRSEKYDTIFKEHLKIINQAFDSMISEHQQKTIEPVQEVFLLKFDKIRAEWIKSGSDDISFGNRYIAKQNYIDPLRMLCIEFIADPRALFILQHTLECIDAYNNIEEVRSVYSKHFLQDALGVEHALIKIKNSLKQFYDFK